MICIYHSRDLDGYCSAAIVKKKYPDAILYGYDHYDPFPLEHPMWKDQHIIMADISLPMEAMSSLAASALSLTWIDHHASVISDFDAYRGYGVQERVILFTPILDSTIAACEGVWKYVYPGIRMPETVELLGKYDSWRNTDPVEWDKRILPFQYGMNLLVSHPDNFPMEMLSNGMDYAVEEVIRKGRILLEYKTQLNARATKHSFEGDLGGYKAIFLNTSGSGSDLFKAVYNEDKHDVMVPFKYDGKKWIFSCYTTKKKVDCSAIAKQFGGGGHKKAAGFSVDNVSLIFPDLK